jgi:hypothetical protein
MASHKEKVRKPPQVAAMTTFSLEPATLPGQPAPDQRDDHKQGNR